MSKYFKLAFCVGVLFLLCVFVCIFTLGSFSVDVDNLVFFPFAFVSG